MSANNTNNNNNNAGKTYVLVHGAYHGGWCWKFVADILRAAGHVVFTPTLTGLGERAHLHIFNPGLNIMIADIVQVIENEELHDVILVGHSFAGAVIAGVVDRSGEKIGHLVYLDALILQAGAAVTDGGSPEMREVFSALRTANGGNGLINTPPVEFFALKTAAQALWVTRRLTPQPVESFFEKLNLNHPLGNGRPVTYITCTDPYFAPTEPSRAIARSMQGWNYLDIATGHDAMISAPEELAKLLAQL
ncbi:MAG TPA: alpha/beta fold hydrolase [Spongiibacteraceae bacterium]|nr:alpha/beta fold hydrolase [Spongiibacteraceae bacterium]